MAHKVCLLYMTFHYEWPFQWQECPKPYSLEIKMAGSLLIDFLCLYLLLHESLRVHERVSVCTHTHRHRCFPASPDTSFLLLIYDFSTLVSVLADAQVTSLLLGIFGKLQEAGKDLDMELTSGWMNNGYRGTPSSLPETRNMCSLEGKYHHISWVVHFPLDRRWMDMRLPGFPETGLLEKNIFLDQYPGSQL